MSEDTIGKPDELEVGFPRTGDRFASVIKLRGEHLAESREGDANDKWPASPPLQQLSIEDLGNGPVGLLVGMAGHSHWSLAVEATGSELIFDAACRVSGAGGKLGSSYRLAENTSVVSEESHVQTTCNDATLHWSADSGADFAECRFEWDAANRTLALCVVDPISDSGTVRWRYRVRVS